MRKLVRYDLRYCSQKYCFLILIFQKVDLVHINIAQMSVK
jgi:hypothetical protein